MVPEIIEQIDREAARQFMQVITDGWDDLHEPAVIELRCLFPGRAPDVQRFAPTPQGISDLVDHAAEMNRRGLNCYPVINPVRASAPLRRDGKASGATDADVIGAFWFWADGDDEAAVYAIRNFAGPAYSMAVTTGRVPFPRPHIYWRIEDGPIRNLETWSRIQQGIAAQLSTDKSVVNPSRIMRLPGMVNWPTDAKIREKGRVAEIATLRTEYDDDRDPVPFERMRRIFEGAAPTAKPADGFQIDTGHDHKTSNEYADILRRARTDGEKHTGVRDLAASLAAQGVNRGMCEAIVREACPVWDNGVETLIETAYSKFYKAPDAPTFDHAPDASDGWAVQSAAAFTADFVAPEYIIEGIIQRGRLYTLTAPTGSGKTAVMLYASIAIAVGQQFCGMECEQGDVLFLAGENPDDVRARVIGTLEFYGIDPSTCRLHFIAGTFSIRADIERLKAEAEKLPNLILTVVDTFAAYFDGDDENSNAQALDFARVVRGITMLPSKPAVVMPAHPVKNATRQNLTPKGGSSLLNEVDGNLTIWNDSGLLSLHWQGKHRGPDFDALKLELESYTSEKLKDRKGRLIPTILAKPVLSMRATQIARQAISIEDRLLLSISDDDSLTTRERAAAIEASKGAFSRAIDRLCRDKLIKKFRRQWVLTKDGETAVEKIIAGQTQPPEAEE